MPVADTTRTTDQPAAVQPGTAAWSDLLRGANGVLQRERLVLQPPQPILMPFNPARQIENELDTRLTS